LATSRKRLRLSTNGPGGDHPESRPNTSNAFGIGLVTMAEMRPSAWLILACLSCSCASPQAAAPSTPPRNSSGADAVSAGGPVAVDFQNVHFHVAPGVVMEVRRLHGALVSRRAGTPPNLDDITSYLLRIDAGEIAMSPESLTNLLNERVFTGGHVPIRNATVTIEDGHLKQRGTLKKGLRVPFTVVGDVSRASDGRIRLSPVAVKAAGVPAAGVMRFLHVELDEVIKSDPDRGFVTDGNDILLSPERLLPDPRISGRLTAVRIEGNRVVQVFGEGASAAAGRGNYMHYRGNLLTFGRLTMKDTDLLLIDADARDAFTFSPGGYVKQLVAGYSKNAPDGSLRVYMPDIEAISSR
jgi:hypothetical protein